MSFQNNLTMKFGYLYPCLCKEVLTGDTWHLDASFGLRFLPTFFPLQTKMKAQIDFFYVRNRNLWKGFQNYLYMTGDPGRFPTIGNKSEQFRTGSLGDYLGLPSTIVGGTKDVGVSSWVVPIGWYLRYPQPSTADISNTYDSDLDALNAEFAAVGFSSSTKPSGFLTWGNFLSTEVRSFVEDGREVAYLRAPFASSFPASAISAIHEGSLSVLISPSPGSTLGFDSPKYLHVRFEDGIMYIRKADVNSAQGTNPLTQQALLIIARSEGYNQSFGDIIPVESPGDLRPLVPSLPQALVTNGAVTPYEVKEFIDNYDGDAIPFEISALPFRAYEQIYNAFYRDDRNNPYYVNGVYDPNVFLPTTDSGPDFNSYVLHRRNWEQDFLTTCQPSPQFGIAPLVGITSRGVATFQDADGVSYTSQLQTAEDGDTIVGFSTTKNTSVNRTLVELASSGISINDLRGVNALQRFLETNIRRGLRYRDQILAHTGVEVGFDELDMPEFLGSVVTRVDVSQINQTTPTGDDPLGSYAGQLSAIGGGSKIQKFCDENGYIIGIISVTPVPCYSQLLPKHFLKVNEPLDFYDSAFAYLGMQPVRYDEVCPLQAVARDLDTTQTFGYQRAWYDYMSSTDEIHGQFRTTLNHFVMARVFNTLPSLNPEFLTIDPNSLNDVFSVSSVEDSEGNRVPIDTILGQIHFDLAAERRIPRYGVPRLE